MRFGRPSVFAIDVLAPTAGRDASFARPVDVWVAGRWLTCRDNEAYVPFFVGMAERLISAVLEDGTFDSPSPDLVPLDLHRRLATENRHGRNRVFYWGETTDNFLSFLVRDGDRVTITAEYQSPEGARPEDLGQVFAATLTERELLRILHGAVLKLRGEEP